jgi:hypothetical protein
MPRHLWTLLLLIWVGLVPPGAACGFVSAGVPPDRGARLYSGTRTSRSIELGDTGSRGEVLRAASRKPAGGGGPDGDLAPAHCQPVAWHVLPGVFCSSPRRGPPRAGTAPPRLRAPPSFS